MLELLNAEAYVGTYDKYYNRNCIDGAWMHLANYTSHEEYIKACAEVQASSLVRCQGWNKNKFE